MSKAAKGSQGLPDGFLIVPELIRGKAASPENSVCHLADQLLLLGQGRSIVEKGTTNYSREARMVLQLLFHCCPPGFLRDSLCFVCLTKLGISLRLQVY